MIVEILTSAALGGALDCARRKSLSKNVVIQATQNSSADTHTKSNDVNAAKATRATTCAEDLYDRAVILAGFATV